MFTQIFSSFIHNYQNLEATKMYFNKLKVAQSCPTLCNPMEYTAHGILQARILEWVVFPFSRGSSQPRDQTQVSHITGRFFTSWTTREAQSAHVSFSVSFNHVFFLAILVSSLYYNRLKVERCGLCPRNDKKTGVEIWEHIVNDSYWGKVELSHVYIPLNSHCLINQLWGFPSGKESACQCRSRRPRFNPWVRKTPWRRAWQPTPVLLPGKFHGQRRLVGYIPWGRREANMTEHNESVAFP